MKFSITTPSFNQAKFLSCTLDSVFTQRGIELEYFVFDGGSTDGSIDRLRQYENHLTYWISEPDHGQAHAINKGFSRSTGEIFAYLNSDDVYTPGALHDVARVFEKYPAIDVVYGNCGYIDAEGFLFRIKTTRKFSLKQLRKKDFLFQPSVFFRKRVYDSIGQLDEQYHYCMDYEYWLRMAEAEMNFFYLPVVLSHMRFHESAKSVSAVKKALHEEKMMKLSYGYSNWEVQFNYLYKRLISRHLWPLKRKVARGLAIVGGHSENFLWLW